MTDLTWEEMLARDAEGEAPDLLRIEAELTAGNAWGAAMFAVGQGLADAVPPMLYGLWQTGVITTAGLAAALPSVWVRNKVPLRGLGERSWLRMFKAARFLVRSLKSP